LLARQPMCRRVIIAASLPSTTSVTMVACSPPLPSARGTPTARTARGPVLLSIRTVPMSANTRRTTSVTMEGHRRRMPSVPSAVTVKIAVPATGRIITGAVSTHVPSTEMAAATMAAAARSTRSVYVAGASNSRPPHHAACAPCRGTSAASANVPCVCSISLVIAGIWNRLC